MPYDWRLAAAATVVSGGGTLVHATEAVFGLAASVAHRDACEQVRRIKHRGGHQAFLVVAQNYFQLQYLVSFDTPLSETIKGSWPGPETWILPAMPGAPPWLRSPDGTIAVRVSAHPQVRELCRRSGPLISTSANPAGRRPARTLRAARHYFGGAVDCYLPGSLGGQQRPSRIRDGHSGVTIRA